MVDLEDLTLQNAVRLEGVKTHLSDALRAELIGLRDELKRLLDADDEIADLSHRDAQKLYAELDALLVQSFAELADALLLRLHELAQVMAAHESAALSAAGVSDVKTVSAAALSAMLDARVLAVEGIYSEPLLAPFVRHYTDAQKTRIAAVVRQGVAQGLTNAQIRQRVIGTKKAGYNDGIVGASVRSGDALVRTAVQHVSSAARQAVAEANADIVAGVRMVATLDSRTSSVCRSIDGRVFPVDSGARPPFHINCRTSFVLVLKGGGFAVGMRRCAKAGRCVGLWRWGVPYCRGAARPGRGGVDGAVPEGVRWLGTGNRICSRSWSKRKRKSVGVRLL